MSGGPYHDAELALQERTGRRALAAALEARLYKEVMPEVATFLPTLAYAVLGSLDGCGRPWASILPGETGFLVPERQRLTIRAQPHPEDPLLANTVRRGDLAMLAIDLAARRRYRINGKAERSPGAIVLDVEQCYRNCPQYINLRQASAAERPAHPSRPRPARRAQALDEGMAALVGASDTFFIATHGTGIPSTDPRLGADVSHRGGNPGFVTVLDDGRRLAFPDYVGNFMFNTLGNLARYPRCGLAFVDFGTGSTLQVTGTASVDWGLERAAAVPGAQRMVDVTVESAIWIDEAIALNWQFLEPARDLRRFRRLVPTRPVPAREASAPDVEGFERVAVAEVIDEADEIRSLYLRPLGGPVRPFLPGQHLRVRATRPGQPQPLTGHYSLSLFEPSAGSYRIGVRRVPGGGEASMSNFLHDGVGVGSELLIGGPQGGFTLDVARGGPVALVSAGIGVTPLLTMLQALAAARRRRPVWFIHGARNGAEQAYAAEVRRISDRLSNVTAHVRFSQPRETDFLGRDHDSVGHVDAELVAGMVPAAADFYLCGPAPFMDGIRHGPRARGVGPDRIHSESFGLPKPAGRPDGLGLQGAKVRFDEAGLQAEWDARFGSLLELAESQGLHPPFACRSGDCGTCEHRLSSGAVAYPTEPSFSPRAEHVLLCCAQPVSDVVVGGP
ncbi:pyridoxamine 5'-phosphate oxidase family protein [Methylobacterium sp. J-070]|uniref:2Fe-2S iron-sulfur cluster-binding protein n=1 Tax=Methylobacterium sp. J-070 TaxID=2836650 RepID=UPI001FBAAF72|nr:pyridoxamine 5'-phosphate oxidase family protein [Methylobacterium sp. J-070]MCJ2048951.1 pyridoxamine 5'-phosphate oxidase family protein [Methylobacterium sp. J-070]